MPVEPGRVQRPRSAQIFIGYLMVLKAAARLSSLISGALSDAPNNFTGISRSEVVETEGHPHLRGEADIQATGRYFRLWTQTGPFEKWYPRQSALGSCNVRRGLASNNMRQYSADDITLLIQQMIRAYYGIRYHRIRRTTLVVGTGSAVSPLASPACLRRASTKPIRRRVALDGLKLSRLSLDLI